MEKKITLPITDEDIKNLKAGDSVLLSGSIITGRDAAHKRLYELIQKGEKLPVDIKGELIYYVGPAPAKPGYAVGPAGPTSSYRMDKYAPSLLDLGLKGMIGKGERSCRCDCSQQGRVSCRNRRCGGAYRQEHQERGDSLL